MGNYCKYPILLDISEIKCIHKQCVPGVPLPPRTPGYEANSIYNHTHTHTHTHTMVASLQMRLNLQANVAIWSQPQAWPHGYS